MSKFEKLLEALPDTKDQLLLVREKYPEIADYISEILVCNNYHKNYKSMNTFDNYLDIAKRIFYQDEYNLHESEANGVPINTFLRDFDTYTQTENSVSLIFDEYLCQLTIPPLTLNDNEDTYLYKIWVTNNDYSDVDNYKYDILFYTNDKEEFEKALVVPADRQNIYYISADGVDRRSGFIINKKFTPSKPH